MQCILKTVFLCILFILFYCEKDKPAVKPYRAGVILSFDDAYVNEWFTTNQKLKNILGKSLFAFSKSILDAITKF